MDYFSYKKRIRPVIAKKKWKDEFGGDLHFSHGSSNFCRVLTAFYGKFFLNVEKKKRSVKALVKKLVVNGKEIYDQAKINDEIKFSLRNH